MTDAVVVDRKEVDVEDAIVYTNECFEKAVSGVSGVLALLESEQRKASIDPAIDACIKHNLHSRGLKVIEMLHGVIRLAASSSSWQISDLQLNQTVGSASNDVDTSSPHVLTTPSSAAVETEAQLAAKYSDVDTVIKVIAQRASLQLYTKDEVLTNISRIMRGPEVAHALRRATAMDCRKLINYLTDCIEHVSKPGDPLSPSVSEPGASKSPTCHPTSTTPVSAAVETGAQLAAKYAPPYWQIAAIKIAGNSAASPTPTAPSAAVETEAKLAAKYSGEEVETGVGNQGGARARPDETQGGHTGGNGSSVQPLPGEGEERHGHIIAHRNAELCPRNRHRQDGCYIGRKGFANERVPVLRHVRHNEWRCSVYLLC